MNTVLVAGLVAVLGLVSSATSAPASALGGATLTAARSGFSKTGSMTHVRAYHTATLLANGRVLIAGGDDNSGALASAELYDPSTGKFTKTGSLLHARDNHTATLLADGRVLITGGMGSGGLSAAVLASAELYDPATGKFKATGSMTRGRRGHTATLLLDGRVLIAGYGESAELYNPATGKFKATGRMTFARTDSAMALLPNGRVLAAGGQNESCASFSNGCTLFQASAEAYNPATGKFSATGSMAHVRFYESATLLPTGRVLIAGGQAIPHSTLASAELYDPATGKFKPTGSMGHARFSQTSTRLTDGRVLIAGGLNNALVSIGSAELYDPVTGKFTSAASMTVARSLDTATLLTDGRVLVTGGLGTAAVLSSAEVWTP